MSGDSGRHPVRAQHAICRDCAGAGRRHWRKLLRAAGWVLGVVFWTSSALSFDPAYPVADPLNTAPAALESGVTLPGDRRSIACPVSKNFAEPLTLHEAVDLALCNNPQIKSTWAQIKVQSGVLGEARAAYLPTITGSLGRTNDQLHYADDRLPSSTVNRNTAQGSVTWRVFDFGGRSENHQAAEKLLAAALASHDAALQKGLAEVIQAYCDLLTIRAKLEAKNEGVELAAQTLRSVQKREGKGAADRSDTLQVATSLAKASLEKNRTQGEGEKARAVLTYTLGVAGNPTIILADDGEEDSAVHGVDELASWLHAAQAKHPALVAAHKQLEAARHQVAAARSAGLPSLGLVASHYRNTRPGEAVTYSEAQETTASVVLSVPIFDGFSSTYKVRGAEAKVEQKEAALENAEQQIAMEVIKAHADASAAIANLQASATLLSAAREAMAVSRRKYEKGALDVVDVLQAQSALADARQERVRCLAEWWAARFRLFASAGLLGRDSFRAR